MGIVEKLFGGKTAVTAESIRTEIARAKAEITAQRATLSNATSSIAEMSDEEHLAVEASVAATKRAIARLEARVTHLNDELPKVIAAEEAAVKLAANEALRQRAQAAHKANTTEAAKLLRRYDELGAQIGDVLARLEQIVEETNVVNEALRKNPGIAEGIAHYDEHHRKHPDRQPGERTAWRKCWVYRYPGSPADTKSAKYQYEAPREEVREATIGPDGKAIPVPAARHDYYGHYLTITPTLEEREIVVDRQYHRPGTRLPSLSEARLPPGQLDLSWHWPRRS